MDFRINEDQRELQQGVRTFCERRVSHERLRALELTAGFDSELWGELADMSVFGLRHDEDAGGMGLGMCEAVLVFAELGRRAVPGPLVWSHVAADLIEGVVGGDVVVGGLELTANADGPVLIEHWASLDALLVVRPEGITRIDARALAAQAITTSLDPLTPVHRVDFLPDGERIGGRSEASAGRRVATVLVAAQLLGIAEAALALALDYAKVREQFGRAIGSFQAIKHILADMFVRQEVARAAVYAAGATIDDPGVGDVARAVSTAKLVAGEAAQKNARACIQIHGGMGYTWEVAAHYYLKRAIVLEHAFGTRDEHAEHLAGQVFALRRSPR